MATFPPIVVDTITDLKNAVWHAGTESSVAAPGWDTVNEVSPGATWLFTNADFTGEVT